MRARLQRLGIYRVSGHAYSAFQGRTPATQTRFFGIFGSLIFGKEDASGFTYMRNRYYNPQTGSFTQTDPIGLAGGLNSYGFAEGDPVTYHDPYGLAAEECCPKWLVDAAAGFGDAVSFGLSGVIRRNTPGGDGVDYGSGAYAGGTLAGAVVTTAGGIGITANAARGASVAAGTRGASIAARASRYDDVTAAGARMTNRATNVTRAEFEANLVQSGFQQTISRNGSVNIFSRDGARYTTRAGAKSTGAPTAEYFSAGARSATLKIRLQP